VWEGVCDVENNSADVAFMGFPDYHGTPFAQYGASGGSAVFSDAATRNLELEEEGQHQQQQQRTREEQQHYVKGELICSARVIGWKPCLDHDAFQGLDLLG
jgi:hypothetical protein